MSRRNKPRFSGVGGNNQGQYGKTAKEKQLERVVAAMQNTQVAQQQAQHQQHIVGKEIRHCPECGRNVFVGGFVVNVFAPIIKSGKVDTYTPMHPDGSVVLCLGCMNWYLVAELALNPKSDPSYWEGRELGQFRSPWLEEYVKKQQEMAEEIKERDDELRMKNEELKPEGTNSDEESDESGPAKSNIIELP